MTPITRRAAFTSAGLAILGSSLAAETKVTSSNDHRLNVPDFGVKADQTTDDTAAFQTAIDAAHWGGRTSKTGRIGQKRPKPVKIGHKWTALD